MAEHNKIASIIIPNRNRTSELLRMVESIPCREDIEVIIVDDDSDITHSYSFLSGAKVDVKVKYLKKRNSSTYTRLYDGLGAGAARNLGIDSAVGCWLFFFDSDDCVDTKNLNLLFDSLYSLDEIDCVYYMAETYNCIEKRNRHAFLLNAFNKYEEDGLDFNLRYYNPVPWSKVVKKDLVLSHNIRFDEILASNDTLFSLQIGVLSTKIHIVKDVIYYISNNDSSLTAGFNEIKSLSRLVSLVNTSNYCLANNIDRIIPFGFKYFVQSKPYKVNSFKFKYYLQYFKLLVLKFYYDK
jgi:glycosyltransferase involved in cell wall biosynthesis